MAAQAGGEVIQRGRNTTGHPGTGHMTIRNTADYDNSEQIVERTELPDPCVVHDVILQVLTADASQTIDVGTSGDASDDPDGFLDAASVNAAGIIQGNFVSTTGSNNTYIGAAATHTIGELLATIIAGEDVANGGDGVAWRHPDLTSGGELISYTGSDTTNTARFIIHVLYTDMTSTLYWD